MADVVQAQTLKSLQASYELCSGQAIKLEKCNVHFIKSTPVDLQNSIFSFLEIREGNGKGKYIGLPYITGRSKKEFFPYMYDKVYGIIFEHKRKIHSPWQPKKS